MEPTRISNARGFEPEVASLMLPTRVQLTAVQPWSSSSHWGSSKFGSEAVLEERTMAMALNRGREQGRQQSTEGSC